MEDYPNWTYLVRWQKRNKGIVFYLLIGMFWLILWKVDAITLNWYILLQSSRLTCVVTLWHRLFVKSITVIVVANKKLYSCGQIWFLRMPNCSFEMDVFNLSKRSSKLLRHLQKTMQILYRFRVGRAGCGGYFT